jgi:hypothetical protein
MLGLHGSWSLTHAPQPNRLRSCLALLFVLVNHLDKRRFSGLVCLYTMSEGPLPTEDAQLTAETPLSNGTGESWAYREARRRLREEQVMVRINLLNIDDSCYPS